MSEQYDRSAQDIAGRLKPKGNVSTVRDYADMGLVDHIRTASGIRLFKLSAVAQIQKLRTERLARRGRPRKAVTA